MSVFKSETFIPISVTGANGTTREHDADETVRPGTTVEGLSGLRPGSP